MTHASRMVAVEYSIEPNCPISEHAGKSKLLLDLSRRECVQIGDLRSKREALEVKNQLEAMLGFSLWVRGTRVG